MDQSNTSKKSYLKTQGALILSELNDLKRTVESCAEDINWNADVVHSIINGDSEPEIVNQFIEACASNYPINGNNLVFSEDDCENGVRFCPKESSIESSRVFNRADRHDQRTPYYEYRDTAMSKLSCFRPEWIKQLRYVEDNDPRNPDVIYNNGHFMHQVTFFVGPVNFYYEVDGVKCCEEMNTGDSNYITPFYPHTFSTRDESEEAYIVAVTFGANVKRALKELYHLGIHRARQFVLDFDDKDKATQQLLDYHLSLNNLNRPLLKEFLNKKGLEFDVLNTDRALSEKELIEIAGVLDIDLLDLVPYATKSKEKVVVKKHSETDPYSFPSQDKPFYTLRKLASSIDLPLVRAFHIEIQSTDETFNPDFCSGLHTYVFHYETEPCVFSWKHNNNVYTKTLNQGDSLYIQPFIEYQFRKLSSNHAPRLCSVGIPGEVTLETQKELSRLRDINRTVFESECWFN